MHRIPLAALALLATLAFAAPAVAASDKAAALKRELGPGAKVAAHRETGNVRFVGTAAGRPIARPAGVSASAAPRTVARAFLAQHGKAFGVADAATELQVTSSHTQRGRSSVRFQQLRGGIPVIGGELVVDLDGAGNVLSASGETGKAAPAMTPRVGSAAARQAAIASVAKQAGVNAVRLQATAPSLWVYDARLLGGPGPHVSQLVWRLEVKGAAGLAINKLVLIDAATGNPALTIEQIHQALNQRVCDANNLPVAPPNTYPCTPAGAVVSEPPSDPPAAGEDDDVEAAYRFAAQTYNFFFDRFGRDSLDDAGMTIISTADYCDPGPPLECPMENAFWDGQQMAYGDGYAIADDVVGHELTHAVTDFSASLFYYYQSGAINESLSDVMGEFLDLTNTPADPAGDRWDLGEDIPGGPIRDMADPTRDPFNHPDSMLSPHYFKSEADNGGVHFNSGVNNKAAFLITDGGSLNGQTVSGIGIDKAARVYYDVQNFYLTSGSDYADLASALPQACADNVGGPEGITSADCTQVGRAVAAVQMTADPGGAAAAPDAPAPSCPSGENLATLFFDDMESFETGGNTNFAPSNPTIWQPLDLYAHSGTWSILGNDVSTRTDSNAFMTRSVAIPANVSSAHLRFDHFYGFDDDDTPANGDQGGYDGGVVEYSIDGGSTWTDLGSRFTANGYDGPIAQFNNPDDSPLAGRQAFIRESHGYISSLADLTPLKGRSVRVRFRIGTDATVGDLGWAFDDVRFFSCTRPAAPPAPPAGNGGGTTPPTGGPPPTATATLAQVRVRSCKRTGRGKKARIRCTLRRFGAVRRATVTVKRGRKTVAKKTVRPTRAGILSLKPKRALRKGTYKVTIVLRDASGGRRTLKTSFKVR